ncbi:MAG: hypothetical protein K8953_05530, partial [Proteobacteria bacterium]|nr:hypothetical protein [Pseudomonadota bacterium]
MTEAVSGTWTGQLRLLVGAGAETFDITLNVNVTGKTITDDGTRPDITAFNSSFGTINIDGKFTANGVIYGTVDFGEPNGNNTVATLTGLIGADGAVGIFASNSAATTAYVGGFVAEKSAVPANCLADAMPFDALCLDDSVRFRLCNGLIADLTAAGGSPTPSDCNTPTLSGRICGTGTGDQSIPGENPFAQICFDTEAYPSGFQPIVAQRVFAEKCASGVQTTNCDKSATGIVGAKSVIECARKPYDETDTIASCKFNPVFNGIRMALDGICLSGGTDPFASDCTDAEYPDLAAQQRGYCETTATTWSNPACNNEALYGTTKATRDAACLADGITGTGHASCADRRNVLDACNLDIFKKTGNDNTVLLCTGTSDSAALGNKPYLTLQGECVVEDTSFASYCNTEDNNDGGSDTAVKMARDAVCLRKVATDINGGTNDCPGRANVLAECTTSGDPFSRTGCDTANGIAGIRTTYCTTNAAKIFDPECNGDVYGGAGVTSKARAVACNAMTALDHESGENITDTTCGNEDTADSGVLYTYCQAYAADDATNCPNTFRIAQNTACENTDPWGSDCDNIIHHSARKARCNANTVPSSALTGTDQTTLCNAVELVTCRSGGVMGGVTVIANPFDTSCGSTYANDRAMACRDNTQGTGDCNTTEIETAVCADSGQNANPFATFCGDEVGMSTSGNIE